MANRSACLSVNRGVERGSTSHDEPLHNYISRASGRVEARAGKEERERNKPKRVPESQGGKREGNHGVEQKEWVPLGFRVRARVHDVLIVIAEQVARTRA